MAMALDQHLEPAFKGISGRSVTMGTLQDAGLGPMFSTGQAYLHSEMAKAEAEPCSGGGRRSFVASGGSMPRPRRRVPITSECRALVEAATRPRRWFSNSTRTEASLQAWRHGGPAWRITSFSDSDLPCTQGRRDPSLRPSRRNARC